MDSSVSSDKFEHELCKVGPPALAYSSARETANRQAGSQEIGVLLIVSGIAGILLPGPVGTPLLILGCVMIWPKTFERVSLFLCAPVSPCTSLRRRDRARVS